MTIEQPTTSIRTGNFNSSTIVSLLSCGKRKMTKEELAARPDKGPGSATTQVEDPAILGESALTYIMECNFERMLGLPLDEDVYAKPLAWGLLCERYVMSNHKLLGLEYTQRPDEPIQHPEIPWWTGTPDNNKDDTVGDIKSPWTRKSFCQLVQPIIDGLTGTDAINALRFGYIDKNGIEHPKHKEGETYYQQIVSNSILISKKYNLDIKFGELIIFMPYASEVEDIISIANQAEGTDLSKFYSIAMSEKERLPHIIEGRYYKNINIIRFPIPDSDKQYLTSIIQERGKLLIDVK